MLPNSASALSMQLVLLCILSFPDLHLWNMHNGSFNPRAAPHRCIHTNLWPYMQGLVAATQGSTQSMSMTLGMAGELGGVAGEGGGSPPKRGAATRGSGDVLAPSATVYRRPYRQVQDNNLAHTSVGLCLIKAQWDSRYMLALPSWHQRIALLEYSMA